MTDTELVPAEPSTETKTPIEMPTEEDWNAFFAYRDYIKFQLLCLQ
jgi:hypothetical protein